jgi:predicted  nucleic acid-binding Zn-ribbon protein
MSAREYSTEVMRSVEQRYVDRATKAEAELVKAKAERDEWNAAWDKKEIENRRLQAEVEQLKQDLYHCRERLQGR